MNLQSLRDSEWLSLARRMESDDVKQGFLSALKCFLANSALVGGLYNDEIRMLAVKIENSDVLSVISYSDFADVLASGIDKSVLDEFLHSLSEESEREIRIIFERKAHKKEYSPRHKPIIGSIYNIHSHYFPGDPIIQSRLQNIKSGNTRDIEKEMKRFISGVLKWSIQVEGKNYAGAMNYPKLKRVADRPSKKKSKYFSANIGSNQTLRDSE